MEAPDGRVTCEIGIAMAVESLLRGGFSVAVPLVDDGYDLLAFYGRRHWRLQVKASSSSGQNASRISIRRGKHKTRRYCQKHVDAFICVNTRTRVVLCVPVATVVGRNWINWSAAGRWSDVGVLHRIRTPSR
jgi:hypothetical protein